MADVSLRDTIDADLGALFEFQADPEASAILKCKQILGSVKRSLGVRAPTPRGRR